MFWEALEQLCLPALLAAVSIAALLHEYQNVWKQHIPGWLQEDLIQMGFLQFGEWEHTQKKRED